MVKTTNEFHDHAIPENKRPGPPPLLNVEGKIYSSCTGARVGRTQC